MSVNFLGVGSGLNLQSMLDQLVQVATEPKVQQLGAKEAQINANISGAGAIRSALAEFQDTVEALQSTSLYGKKTADVTQPESGDVLTASASSDAVEGSYSITVKQLAEGSRLQSASQFADTTSAQSDSGTLTFTAGSDSFDISVDTSDSIEDIVNKINDSDDNFGVSATIVDGWLVYKSDVTGDTNTLTVTNDDASLDDYSTSMTTEQAAQSAVIEADGISISSDTNEFAGQIQGLTINVSAVDEDNAATLVVGKNKSSISSAINEMAEAYNSVITQVNKQSGTTNEDGEFSAGPMFGDPLLRQIKGMLGDAMSSMVPGSSDTLNNMYAVGLELQSDGTLEVDSDQLTSALNQNFDDFESLFSSSNDDGFAVTLGAQLESYLEFGGVLDSIEDGYDLQLEDIETQYENHIQYINSYTETLKKQFASLDSTMATLNAQMQYMSGQLQQLSNINSSS